MVHNLPQKVNLLPTALNGLPYVGQYLCLGPHPFVSPRVRHDTERTMVVAALDDGHVRFHRIAPARNAQREADIVPWIDVHLGKGRRGGFLQQHRKHLESLGAHDDINHVAIGAPQQCPPFLLGHASSHGNHGTASRGFAQHPEFAEPRVELVLGVLAHAAGVDHDHVGVRVAPGRLVASLVQEPGHSL